MSSSPLLSTMDPVLESNSFTSMIAADQSADDVDGVCERLLPSLPIDDVSSSVMMS